MLYVSFISTPGCLAAEAGLVAPLCPCPDAHVAPFLGLRHGQAPYARPPAPKLPQPLIEYTLLPLLPSVAAASAVPNWNALPLRCRNLGQSSSPP